MTDGPRPIGDDLSDEALFADHPPTSMMPAEATETVQAAVASAIRVLRAANLNPGFGFDVADAERIWGMKLGRYGANAILKAAGEWVDGQGNEFPTLADFEAVVSAVSAEMRRPAAPDRPPGQVCPECFDEPGNWVYLNNPGPGQTATVRPCSLCRPEYHEMHEKGHNMPRVGNESCRCFQSGCLHQKRRARAKDKTR